MREIELTDTRDEQIVTFNLNVCQVDRKLNSLRNAFVAFAAGVKENQLQFIPETHTKIKDKEEAKLFTQNPLESTVKAKLVKKIAGKTTSQSVQVILQYLFDKETRKHLGWTNRIPLKNTPLSDSMFEVIGLLDKNVTSKSFKAAMSDHFRGSFYYQNKVSIEC